MPIVNHHNRQGFSLIEAAIVLGIVGLVIGGIWVAASAVTERRKINRTLEQVGIVLQNARTKLKPSFTSAAVSYWFATPCVPGRTCIPKTGWSAYLPSDMVGNLNSPVSAYGLMADIAMSSSYLSFSFDLGDNVKACTQLGPLLANQYRSEIVDGAPFAVVTYNDGADISTPANASANCRSEYANNGSVGLAFSFNP